MTKLDLKELKKRDFVITPGGPRHRSRVYNLSKHEKILQVGKKLKVKNLLTEKTNELQASAEVLNGEVAQGGGWNVAVSWENTTGDPIYEFTTVWTVPAEPVNKANQIVYLFNGIESADSSHILQPVLQWGAYDQETKVGGQFWCVANWYVPAEGVAAVSPWVQVAPGQKLTGVMTCIDENNGKFTYESTFREFPKTTLSVPDIPELIWCSVTLESYNITSCGMFPQAQKTAFNGINIRCKNSVPNVVWTPEIVDNSCGQGVNIVANNGMNGIVDIGYSPAV